jgi:hypothetical protein
MGIYLSEGCTNKTKRNGNKESHSVGTIIIYQKDPDKTEKIKLKSIR